MSNTQTYRAIVREVSKASIVPRASRSRTLLSTLRSIVEQRPEAADTHAFDSDLQNAVTFLRSQRMHKVLLDRYNPLVDLTGEERIEATARRVGLNMPIVPPSE
ncbi:hypothetical protein FA95DRAFT_1604238 [Auriscalpium vulgare]|uniref:Uncharacterized protein n=1 Tax=Auriscalpium vulgare TaxID=40419 RepID=A0ACB8S0G9_9AGAM|nr:hypothetical protein FA95DRAFT_1604238 [Auriscalpium vulgare]